MENNVGMAAQKEGYANNVGARPIKKNTFLQAALMSNSLV